MIYETIRIVNENFRRCVARTLLSGRLSVGGQRIELLQLPVGLLGLSREEAA